MGAALGWELFSTPYILKNIIWNLFIHSHARSYWAMTFLLLSRMKEPRLKLVDLLLLIHCNFEPWFLDFYFFYPEIGPTLNLENHLCSLAKLFPSWHTQPYLILQLFSLRPRIIFLFSHFMLNCYFCPFSHLQITNGHWLDIYK